MASRTKQRSTTSPEYEQAFPDWVYQVPGILLIAAGFGGLVFLTFA
jgi:hypothetical protein